MAYGYVQENDVITGAVSSKTINFSGNTTAGNRAILITCVWSGTITPTVSTVADAKNGSWHQDASIAGVAGSYHWNMSIWSVQIATQLLSTDTITISYSGTVGSGRAAVLEYSGISTASGASAVDVTTGTANGGGSTTPSTGTTSATGAAHELVLILYGEDAENNAWSSAPSGTVRVNHMSDGGDADLWVAEADSGSSGTTQSASGTLTTSTPWSMLIIAYKLASGAAVLPLNVPHLIPQAVKRAAYW